MQSTKEWITARRQRLQEYEEMRCALLRIALAPETQDADRVNAVSVIFKIDSEGVPEP